MFSGIANPSRIFRLAFKLEKMDEKKSNIFFKLLWSWWCVRNYPLVRYLRRVLFPDSPTEILLWGKPDTDPGFWWTKIEKKIHLKFFSLLFLIKNCNLHIPRPPQRTSKLQDEKPSALKKNIQHFERCNLLPVLNFSGSFLPSCIRIRIRMRIRNILMRIQGPHWIHNTVL